MTGPATDTFRVFGTTAVLIVTDEAALAAARTITDSELDAVDKACSRFRPDSELSKLNGSSGALTPVSELFAELIAEATPCGGTDRRRRRSDLRAGADQRGIRP